MKKFLAVFRRFAVGGDPAHRAFNALTFAIFGSWSLLAAFVLAGGLRGLARNGMISMMDFTSWPDIPEPPEPPYLLVLFICVGCLFAAVAVVRHWQFRLKWRFAWLCIIAVLAVVGGAVGQRWGAAWGAVAILLAAIWVFPMAAYSDQWKLVLLRGALWTLPAVWFKFPGEKFVIRKFGADAPATNDIWLSPGDLLLQELKVGALIAMLLAGYVLTAVIHARAGNQPWRKMFGREVKLTLAVCAAIYLLSVGMAFAAQRRADRAMAELEKFFGAPLTAETVEKRYYEGREADGEFWNKLMMLVNNYYDNWTKWGDLANCGDETLTPERFRAWKRDFESDAELKRIEENFDTVPPAEHRTYCRKSLTDLACDNVPRLRHMFSYELWRIRFAVADRDERGALAALRKMENLREHLTYDDIVTSRLIMVRGENLRLDALERLLAAGLLSDAELRRQQTLLDACERGFDRLHRLSVRTEVTEILETWFGDMRKGLNVREFWPKSSNYDAAWPYRWFFPPYWYLYEANREALAEVCRADDFCELARRVPPLSDRNVLIWEYGNGLRSVGERMNALKFRYALMRALIDVELEKRRTGKYPAILKAPPVDPVTGKAATFINGEFTVMEKPWTPPMQSSKDPVERKVRGLRLQSPDGKISAKIILGPADAESGRKR
ncbi:MAG: hypothetical protein IJJ28_01055 [Lentisphaeria bacterium]|nr:hypothetical protein [Lentisphaeria bacterium]